MTQPAPDATDQGAMSIDDTAVFLGRISRRQVYRLIQDGHLDRIHIGRRALITRASCDRYLASLTTKA
ncbi:helix-turn-helix DNA-binding protein [Gordonia phage Jabberwocky]|uniref:Helix-turn-helix DNA-binding protein n=1 Tax=Gordonia phage Jabberwocky TaxID=2653273 RepID=A0A5P8D4T9_9CAUD|nr:helix-turn-helix DNA binding protein [Gordonia phage Jabberwocky]QFP94107.1 helix-turn-helix DNA-binding protein [Gordonia phage Jabberwocky]